MTTPRGQRILTGLAIAAAMLVTVELALGALHYGKPQLADPCTTKPAFKGGGIDGATQRFALSTLNGAACSLHTSREALVLSFVPSAHTTTIHWNKPTINQALQAGLTRAAHDLAGTGISGRALAYILRNTITPTIDWYLDHQP